jgi:hypothetical protein
MRETHLIAEAVTRHGNAKPNGRAREAPLRLSASAIHQRDAAGGYGGPTATATRFVIIEAATTDTAASIVP